MRELRQIARQYMARERPGYMWGWSHRRHVHAATVVSPCKDRIMITEQNARLNDHVSWSTPRCCVD